MSSVRPSRIGRPHELTAAQSSTGVVTGDDIDWPTGPFTPTGTEFDVPAITYGTPAEGSDPTAIRTDAVLPGPPIVILTLTNKSGGGVVAGDVVVIDTANDTAFTTTTTGQAEVSVGIAQATIANNASGAVLVQGYAALVNVPSSMTRGRYLETHTVAKQATGSATRRAGSFGQFLIAGTTPTAWLWGSTDQTASGGGATITTKDEGGTLSSTVTTLDFVGAGVTATGGGATTTITIPGGSSGVTHSYIGYNTAGGSTENGVHGGVWAKKVTLASSTFIASVGAYVTESANGTPQMFGGVMSDTGATVPFLWIAGPTLLSQIAMTTTAGGSLHQRWLDVPVGAYLAAGDYWLVIGTYVSNAAAIAIAYDGSGTDQTWNSAQLWTSDGGRYTITTGTRKYSIRAGVLS